MEKHQTLSIRQRGYLPSDPAAETIIVYENDAVPLNPDGTEMKKIWDNDVVTHTVVKPHIEPPG